MSYTARCALCMDTSPHCPCRMQGNGYWAPGAYERREAKPCECFICQKPSQANLLRKKYGLRPHVVAPNDPAREQEWNELARVFLQRFQQIHQIPPDSLAGPHSFKLLEAIAEGRGRK